MTLVVASLLILCGERVWAFDCNALVESLGDDWRRGNVAAVADALRVKEIDCSSDLRFNRVLGEALLASGRPADALMPLERAVTIASDDKASWRALTQSWLVLGDREAAMAASLAGNGSQGSASEERAGERLHWRFGVEGSRGHDSNATLATSEKSIAVPALDGAIVTLGPASRQRGDSYWGEVVNAEAEVAISPTWVMQIAGADSRRQYDHLHWASSEEQTLSARLEQSNDWGFWSLGVHGTRQWQGKEDVRFGTGATLSWRPGQASSLWPTLALDVTRYRYNGSFRMVEGFIEHSLSLSNSVAIGQKTLGWALQAGHDVATESRADGDRNIIGARIYATGPITNTVEWLTWLDHLDSRYNHVNPAFLVDRHEAIDTWNGEVSWAVNKWLSVRGLVSLSRQHANIPLYDYRRADTSLTLSYAFGG
ncbi:hypothetical protein OL229_02600 [Neisseriaceae bacterium JH1-16]|nr:hypothetical protein [Neisseriaceae bacterium JH1-16]